MAYQQSVDPQGMFIDDFYRSGILGEVQARATKVYPRCALVYDYVCQMDDHCAENQKCIPAPLQDGKTANICLDKSQEAGLIGTFEALKDDFDQTRPNFSDQPDRVLWYVKTHLTDHSLERFSQEALPDSHFGAASEPPITPKGLSEVL
jgi:hypothetical protein